MRVTTKNTRHGPFPTADGSTRTEIVGPIWTTAQNQSLSEITLEVGQQTRASSHTESEELLLFIAGLGRVRCGTEERIVGSGDCVIVPPRTEHKVSNTGEKQLVWLSCCAPACRQENTVVSE